MTGQTNGQSGPEDAEQTSWKELAQSSGTLVNDLVASPFISGVVQGFISVAMQRRRERRQAREAANTTSTDNNKGDTNIDNNDKIDSMDISAKLKNSLLAPGNQPNGSL